MRETGRARPDSPIREVHLYGKNVFAPSSFPRFQRFHCTCNSVSQGIRSKFLITVRVAYSEHYFIMYHSIVMNKTFVPKVVRKK